MSNEYYDHTTYPTTSSTLASSAMRSELDIIAAGFDKLPALTGNGGKLTAINAGGTAVEAIVTTGTGSGVRSTSPALVTPDIGAANATSINRVNIEGVATGATFALANNSSLSSFGSYVSNFTFTGNTSVTFPTSGLLALSGDNTDIASLGNVAVPTQSNGTANTLIANTLFVSNATATVLDNLANTSDAAKGAGLVGFKQVGTGSVARTVYSKLQESVSVKDFGAVGDGVTDDTAAVQAAITNAFVDKRPVYLPAGQYRITAPLNVRSASATNAFTLEIYGDPNLNTQIIMDNNSAASVFVYNNGWKDTVVIGCAVTNGSATMTTTNDFVAAGVQPGDFVAIQGNIGNTVSTVSSGSITLSANSYLSASGLTATFYNTSEIAKNALNIRNLYITNTMTTGAYTTFHPAFAMNFNGVVNSYFENIRIDGFTRGWNTLGGWLNRFKNCKVWTSREGFFVNAPDYLWSFDSCGTAECGAIGYNASTFRFGGGLTFKDWIQETDQTSFTLESIRGASIVGGNIESITFTSSILLRAMPSVGGNDKNYWTRGITFQGLRIYNSLGFIFQEGVEDVRVIGVAFEWFDLGTINASYWINVNGKENLIQNIDFSGVSYPPGYPSPVSYMTPGTNTDSQAQSVSESGKIYSNAIPYWGKYWQNGTIVYTTPSAVTSGSYIGWVCTASADSINDGSATWKTFGAIS
jgi:hypothetical protein